VLNSTVLVQEGWDGKQLSSYIFTCTIAASQGKHTMHLALASTCTVSVCCLLGHGLLETVEQQAPIFCRGCSQLQGPAHRTPQEGGRRGWNRPRPRHQVSAYTLYGMLKSQLVSVQRIWWCRWYRCASSRVVGWWGGTPTVPSKHMQPNAPYAH
jgi:hypothetical protein